MERPVIFSRETKKGKILIQLKVSFQFLFNFLFVMRKCQYLHGKYDEEKHPQTRSKISLGDNYSIKMSFFIIYNFLLQIVDRYIIPANSNIFELMVRVTLLKQMPLAQACTTYGQRAKCGPRKLLNWPSKPNILCFKEVFLRHMHP